MATTRLRPSRRLRPKPGGRPAPAAIPRWLRAGARRAAALIRRRKDIAAAYLYGSSLNRPDYEDVDLALIRAPGRKQSTSKLALSLDRAFGREADIHYVDELPDPVAFRVVREGARLAVADPLAAARFEAELLTRFLEFKPTYDRLTELVLRRAARG